MEKARFDHRKYRAFQPIAKPDRRWPDNVIQAAPEWCSVDLRDGNQALVEPMNAEQKLRLWELLVSIGFKQIEVGFPSASSHDFAFLRKLIEEQRIPDDVTVQVLVQARADLIEKTFAALEGVKRAVVHFYNSTSTVQREYVFGLDRDGIRDIAVSGARLIKKAADARPETEWVFEYSPESFTGTEMEFALSVCDAVNEVLVPTHDRPVIINLPATVEMSTPNIWERFTVHLSRFLNLLRITLFDDWFPAIFIEMRMFTHGFGQPKRLAESLSFVTVQSSKGPGSSTLGRRSEEMRHLPRCVGHSSR